jgi:hypothetical protein
MDRSPGFGSIPCDFAPVKTRFRYGSVLYVLNLATHNNSPDRSTKSTLSDINVLQLLVNAGFQVLFHSPLGVLFTFPSRYCFTIGHCLVFSLGGWSPLLPTRFLVSRGTLDTDPTLVIFAYGTFTLYGRSFPATHSAKNQSLYVGPQPRVVKDVSVWAIPRSLAATYGITIVFFSCGYLDVSVLRVSLQQAMYSPEGA